MYQARSSVKVNWERIGPGVWVICSKDAVTEIWLLHGSTGSIAVSGGHQPMAGKTRRTPEQALEALAECLSVSQAYGILPQTIRSLDAPEDAHDKR